MVFAAMTTVLGAGLMCGANSSRGGQSCISSRRTESQLTWNFRRFDLRWSCNCWRWCRYRLISSSSISWRSLACTYSRTAHRLLRDWLANWWSYRIVRICHLLFTYFGYKDLTSRLQLDQLRGPKEHGCITRTVAHPLRSSADPSWTLRPHRSILFT